MSDDRDFSPSPSPPEDWGNESDQEWPVAGIVGESVDAFDVKRYEVKWGENWTRKDGTNTTWDRPREELQQLIEEWGRRQAEKRTASAEASPAIEIGVEEWQMLHEDRTVELARGYEELKKVHLHPRLGDPRRPVDFDGALRRLRGPVSGNASRETSHGARSSRSQERSTTRSRDSSSGAPARRGRERSGTETSSTSSLHARPVRPLPKRAAIRRVSSSPASEDAGEEDVQAPRSRAPGPSRASKPRELKRRKALEKNWARRLDDAAPVTFVNEVNYEEVPPLVDGFEYLERSYSRASDVVSIDNLVECLVSCECDDRCVDAAECGCQGPSELEDDRGKKIFAYTRKRLFNFELPPGMEIIECNESCSCGERCPNRVAQLPRDVPIEVFRTRDRGWGARATVMLPRGKVVGLYTGQLIRREEAGQYQGERKTYIFDLDVHEGSDDDDDEADRYSVDGYAYGNWTRFVNHSCEPNMRVVPVVWDTIPELKQPYLAFVATEDIEPRTELTIDYDPKAGQEARKGKSKTRQEIPKGARACMCGTDSCRGWVRV